MADADQDRSVAGQWYGEVLAEGDLIVLDLDDLGTSAQGTAHFYRQDPHGPDFMVELDGVPSRGGFSRRVTPVPISPVGTRLPLPPGSDTAKIWPGRTLPNFADIGVEWSGEDQLIVKWETRPGAERTTTLNRFDPHRPSALVPVNEGMISWTDYVSLVLTEEFSGMSFRGQAEPWRLSTTFHRSSRKDLFRFVNEDVPNLHRNLSSLTRHHFDLNDAGEHGAFVALLQHHGYPTPLLDWTESPFVAAYFAFRTRRGPLTATPVRVYVFDRVAWSRDMLRNSWIAHSRPHLSLLLANTVENPRAVPQQAFSTITNMADVEAWIAFIELRGRRYLRCIDLNYEDRDLALRHLKLMGITAGSMMPGLDGACEAIAQVSFRGR